MPNVLTCALLSNRTPSNTARPGDTVRFEFSKLPQKATGVTISISQVTPSGKGDTSTSRLLIQYTGDVENHQFKTRDKSVSPIPEAVGAPLFVTDGSTIDEVLLLDNDFTYRHQLKVDVKGKVGTENVAFNGKTPLIVQYPLVMIAPTKTAKSDLSLNPLAKWAQQWKAADPSLRTLITITPTKPGAPATPKDFDELVECFQSAVRAAPFGIVALAVGHGDGGSGIDGVPWGHLVPEDRAPVRLDDGSQVMRGHTRYLTLTELSFGTRKGSIPNRSDRAKMGALDRIAKQLLSETQASRAAFKKIKTLTPLRKLVLHTCNVGHSPLFVAHIADRVGVPVQAHLDYIEYEGKPTATVLARYQSGKEASATEWPTAKLAKEELPIGLLAGKKLDPERQRPIPSEQWKDL